MSVNGKFKITLIAVLVVGITGFHYSTKLSQHHLHIIHQGLYYVPLILAGFWYGLRGALVTCVCVTLAVLPFIMISWGGFSPDDFARLMEIGHYFMVSFVLGILRDRERAEQMRVRNAERLAAMGKALSGVAHDMKTPLMAIGGFTRQVMTKARKVGTGPGEFSGFVTETEEKLSIVIKETQRMESMLKDMLDFARPLELGLSREDIHKVVEESLAVVTSIADEKGIPLLNRCADDLPKVSLDVMRMKQVLINLLINAIQASPERETVTIRGYPDGKWLVLEVTDCGCGIPRNKREEIFVPFYTTKQDGTGLGLPIVKKIVEAHRGRIQILDNPGPGLTFRVAIPIT
ncbi:MAG: hypothetical protein C4576_03105 [Desulfobacteraceae bacterium]|nr:MAG: hypothetical protein C4576_03105 [Desulfobacteraceae bacterium]